ncbi:MAG: hypothetical protein FD166_3617 [Bacteroidetes bacterium]|nr:MAG: hypothetical protein FD166_3617 [Bacteroidota bacterium]
MLDSSTISTQYCIVFQPLRVTERLGLSCIFLPLSEGSFETFFTMRKNPEKKMYRDN